MCLCSFHISSWTNDPAAWNKHTSKFLNQYPAAISCNSHAHCTRKNMPYPEPVPEPPSPRPSINPTFHQPDLPSTRKPACASGTCRTIPLYPGKPIVIVKVSPPAWSSESPLTPKTIKPDLSFAFGQKCLQEGSLFFLIGVENGWSKACFSWRNLWNSIVWVSQTRLVCHFVALDSMSKGKISCFDFLVTQSCRNEDIVSKPNNNAFVAFDFSLTCNNRSRRSGPTIRSLILGALICYPPIVAAEFVHKASSTLEVMPDAMHYATQKKWNQVPFWQWDFCVLICFASRVTSSVDKAKWNFHFNGNHIIRVAHFKFHALEVSFLSYLTCNSPSNQSPSLSRTIMTTPMQSSMREGSSQSRVPEGMLNRHLPQRKEDGMYCCLYLGFLSVFFLSNPSSYSVKNSRQF